MVDIDEKIKKKNVNFYRWESVSKMWRKTISVFVLDKIIRDAGNFFHLHLIITFWIIVRSISLEFACSRFFSSLDTMKINLVSLCFSLTLLSSVRFRLLSLKIGGTRAELARFFERIGQIQHTKNWSCLFYNWSKIERIINQGEEREKTKKKNISMLHIFAQTLSQPN